MRGPELIQAWPAIFLKKIVQNNNEVAQIGAAFFLGPQ